MGCDISVRALLGIRTFPDAAPGSCQRLSRTILYSRSQIYFNPSRLPLIHDVYSLSFMNCHIMLICHDNLYFHVS